MPQSSRFLSIALLPILLAMSLFATASNMLSVGAVYSIALPASTDFKEVVDRLEQEIAARNWEVLKVQDIDEGLKKNYGLDIQNKIIYACKSQYLAQAIKEDPKISLIVPCRFAVYRVGPKGEATGAMADMSKGGAVVVKIANPVHEAETLGIKPRMAVGIASKEIRDILKAVAEAFMTK